MAVRRKRTIGRRWVERIAITFLLGLAWIWIVAMGAILFHTINSPRKQPTDTNSDFDAAASSLSDKRQHQRVSPDALSDLQSSQDSRFQRQHDKTGEGRGNEDLSTFDSFTPLLIFTCHRAEYLRETMTQIMKYIPSTLENGIGFPVIVSQDGKDGDVADTVQSFQKEHNNANNLPVLHWQHDPFRPGIRGGADAYKELAMHYGWALRRVFQEFPKATGVIILEEDLRISPDFFAYFARTEPLLQQDQSLLAVSAFNDNGKHEKVRDATRVLRSDFFPGLGWMMTRRLWDEELSSKWPQGYWDDWLREPAQRKGRHILRPEVRANTRTQSHPCSCTDRTMGSSYSTYGLKSWIDVVQSGQVECLCSRPCQHLTVCFVHSFHPSYRVQFRLLHALPTA